VANVSSAKPDGAAVARGAGVDRDSDSDDDEDYLMKIRRLARDYIPYPMPVLVAGKVRVWACLGCRGHVPPTTTS
jgi:hypothetical protein